MRVRAKALVDANVLWSAQQRNILLQLAVQETISVFWTQEILEEWLRNVEPDLRRRLEDRTLPLMCRHFPNAIVAASAPGHDLGRTQTRDRHVASAALSLAPAALVTWNVRDFDARALARGSVHICTPDAFLVARFAEAPDLIYAIVREAQVNLTKSSPNWSDYLELLAGKNRLQTFVGKIRNFERENG